MIEIRGKKIKIALALVIIIQISVLALEFIGANYPAWTGTEIYLKTVPVDPRDLFRGNYARLSYDISSVPAKDLLDRPEKIRTGEVIYVKLRKKGSLYELNGATFKKPASGIFLRGRIEDRYITKEKTQFTVKYGLEAFFAKKEKALALEKDLRAGSGIAIVKVASNGRSALLDVKKSEP